MKKKLLPLLLLSAVLMTAFTSSALAQTYTFSEPQISLNLIDTDYTVILPRDNLAANEEWLLSNGYTVEGMRSVFDSNGILLQAVDAASDRTFVLSAQVTVDSEMYFDVNLQDNDMRKEFRTSHTNGTAYGLLGYNYSRSTWKNYGGTLLRFLCTEYSFRENGQVEHYGYQRRTIRNGYTITLDMQVRNRTLKSSDEKALENMMDGFQFTQILSMPKLPVKRSFTSEPPSSTSSASFTIKGSSARNATVHVNVLSLTSASSSVFTATANSNGDFSVKVTLPEPGVYSVVVSAEAEDTLRTQISYSVTYQSK